MISFTYECIQCNLTFAGAQELEQHVLENHQQPCSTRQSQCYPTTSAQSNIFQRVNLLTDYSCEQCGISFADPTEFESHKEVCLFAFFNYTHEELNAILEDQSHLPSTSQTPSANLVCHRCNLTFEIAADFETHIQQCPNLLCYRCGLSFTSLAEFETHMQHCSPRSPPAPQQWPTNENYVIIFPFMEVQRLYLYVDPFTLAAENSNISISCRMCGSIFPVAELDAHVQLCFPRSSSQGTTSNQILNINHLCHTCGFGCETAVEFETHIQQCCPRFLTSSVTHDSHLEAVQTEEETVYHCADCGKRFRMKVDLRTHWDVHRANNIYWCDVCLEGFKTKKKLLEHIQTAHLRME